MIPTGPEAFPTGPQDRALTVLDLVRAGRFAEIRNLFTEGDALV